MQLWMIPLSQMRVFAITSAAILFEELIVYSMKMFILQGIADFKLLRF